MKCPHCDCNHPDGTKFCPNTGKKIELLACQNQKCSEYGKQQYPLNAKYCPKCGYKLQKQTDASVFMSFHNITLGGTNIYDIEADEYQKSNDSIFGNIKVICVEDVDFEGNTITCFARQSDRKIFSLSFESISDIVFPESWISEGLDADNLMVSMEKLLCKRDFQWQEYEDECNDTFGFAYKEIDSDLFLVFSVQDDKMMVSLLTEEMKDSLLRQYEEENEEDDGEDYDDDYDDDDDDDDYDDDEDEDEDDNDDYDDDDYDDDEDEDEENVIDKFFPICGITLGKTSKNDLGAYKFLLEIEYCNDGDVIAWFDGAQIRQPSYDDCFTRIYTTRFHTMFEKWRSIGFNWSLSYDRWVSLLQGMGFEIEVIKYPTTVFWDNRNTLSAEFIATSDDGYLEFEFDFGYGNDNGEGYSTSSRNSLYSISCRTL